MQKERLMIEGMVGFIGAGQMAQALASGWVRSGLVTAERLCAHDPQTAAAERFDERVGGGCSLLESVEEVARRSDLLFVAVKPHHAEGVLVEAAPFVGRDKLIASIAAGFSLQKIEALLPSETPVIRIMPNTPSLIGRGASCYARGTHASLEHAELVRTLLAAVGSASETTEPLLDAVTGLSGSGPAFVYTMIEAMADGGVRAGLPRQLAADLAARTVAGAAEMVIVTGQHPAALRDAVSSPGGTTVAGLAELERHGVRAALNDAVYAAASRAAELGHP